MGRRVVSDFHMAGIVCHVLCLLILVLVADRIPSASSATAEVGDVASLVASGDNRPLFGTKFLQLSMQTVLYNYTVTRCNMT